MSRSAASLAHLALMSMLALLLGGCPKVLPPKSQFPTAADALDRMKATFSCANGVSGQGKIDHFSKQGRIRGEVTLFAINPARVRIDVPSPFGLMLFTLTSDGENFRLYDGKQKQFLHGPSKPCNLARMTHVPVPGHVLVYLMRGEAPLLKHERSAPTIAWDDGVYRVDLPSTRGAKQLLELEVYEQDFDKPWSQQRLRVRKLTTSQHGVVLYVAELDDYELTSTAPPREDDEGIDDPVPPSGGPCNVEAPRKIQLLVPSSGDDVVFDYAKIHFNPPILEGTFSQPVPGGVQKIFVDCK